MTRPTLHLEPLESREVPAAIGALDQTFGGSGLLGVAIDAGGVARPDGGFAVAVQADGKIVLAGRAEVAPGNFDMAAVRLLPDGSRDESFGPNGQRTVKFDFGGNNFDEAFGVAVQADGKIVLVGSTQLSATDFDFAFARLLPDGTLDPLFNPAGAQPGTAVVAFDQGGDDRDVGSAVVIQPDGKIVASGFVQRSATDFDFAVVRLLPIGSPDPAFTPGNFGDGRAVVAFDGGGNNDDRAFGLALQPDGKIVVAGTATRATGSDFAVARLNTDGTIDQAFGNQQTQNTQGKRLIGFDFGGSNVDVGNEVALQADGRIVVVGSVQQSATDTDFGVARLTADGELDGTFGTGFGTGRMVVPFDLGGNFADVATDVLVGPFGKIVVVGRAQAGANGTDFAAVRLNPDGTGDQSFGPSGKRTFGFDFGGAKNDSAEAVALQADGKILVVGTVDQAGTDTDFGVVRLTGALGLPNPLAVSGLPTGAVPIFRADDGLAYNITPVATLTPIPGQAVNSVIADVNGDGIVDLISGVNAGGDRVVVLSGFNGTVLASFAAFGGYTGGVFVAAGDLNGDGKAEVIASPVLGGLGPRVAVFLGSSLTGGTSTPTKIADFNGIADAQTGAADNSPGTIQLVGARVAVADVNGDGFADLAVAAGNNGGPRITIWDGKNVASAGGSTPPAPPLANAFVFEDTQRDGAFVTLGDVTGDGLADLIAGGGPNGGPRVRIGDMAAILAAKNFGKFDDALGVVKSNFLAGDPASRGGIRVAARDVDGDNLADLVTGSGSGLRSQVQFFRGTRLVTFTSGIQTGDQIEDPFGLTLPGGVFVG